MPEPESGALFASYNVHKCVGIDRKFDPARTAAVIAEIAPDVIALQEADRRFGTRAGLLDLEAVGRELGLSRVAVSNGHAGHGWHGNVLLVRDAMVKDIHLARLPGLEPRGAVVADLDLTTGPVRVMAAHLGLLRQSRLMQIDTLLELAGEGDRPVVLMGDLNEWRWRKRSALGTFAPAFGPLGRGVPSFPSYFPIWPLDRIMSRPHQILGTLAVHDTPLARQASDHLPVKARIRLERVPDTAIPARRGAAGLEARR